jgi:hypothetical protein
MAAHHATGAWVLLPRAELAGARVERRRIVAGARPPLLLLRWRGAPLLRGPHAPAQLLLLRLGCRLHLRLLLRRRVLLLLLALLPEHRIDIHPRLAQLYGHLCSEDKQGLMPPASTTLLDETFQLDASPQLQTLLSMSSHDWADDVLMKDQHPAEPAQQMQRFRTLPVSQLL